VVRQPSRSHTYLGKRIDLASLGAGLASATWHCNVCERQPRPICWPVSQPQLRSWTERKPAVVA